MIKDIFLVLFILFLVIALKEGSHFALALYYDLDPWFQITEDSFGTTTYLSSNILVSRLMNIIGILTNIVFAIAAFVVLFVLSIYIPRKKRFNLKLFLFIFALANLLLILSMFGVYIYRGVF